MDTQTLDSGGQRALTTEEDVFTPRDFLDKYNPVTAYSVLETGNWNHENEEVYVNDSEFPDAINGKHELPEYMWERLDGANKVLGAITAPIFDLPRFAGRKSSTLSNDREIKYESSLSKTAEALGATTILYDLAEETSFFPSYAPDLPEELGVAALGALAGSYFLKGRVEGNLKNRAEKYFDDLDEELEYEIKTF